MVSSLLLRGYRQRGLGRIHRVRVVRPRPIAMGTVLSINNDLDMGSGLGMGPVRRRPLRFMRGRHHIRGRYRPRHLRYL